MPTPLNKNREPDISYILEDREKRSRPILQKGTLVVLESTTYPGTTDEDLREVLETGFRPEGGHGFSSRLFARARRSRQSGQQGRADSQGRRRSHAGVPRESAKALYGKAIKTIVPVSSCRARRGDEAARKHFPRRQHRAGERTEGGLRRDGH